eukprot:TRINITY_DN8941_c0_g1_i1.p1 TRINITY_DN8941_c0_g1~~TRINITY_DN8941_c0_g1_i1.p1  ORF type:complete len:435 (+),score=103.86 TRINITY_DN8941_c0_g1_i1:140-1444(+)
MFTATRTISMSHWQQFSLAGPHVANTTAGAMKLYDVDGDGCNELILGLTDGWLAVYKDNQLKASTSVNDTITAVTCGYLQALDTTAIVTMTTTGQVYFHGCTPGVNTLELLDRVPFHVNVKSFKLSNNIQPNATMLIIGRVDRIAELVEITAKPASTPVGNSRAQHMFHGHRLSLSIVRREALKHQVGGIAESLTDHAPPLLAFTQAQGTIATMTADSEPETIKVFSTLASNTNPAAFDIANGPPNTPLLVTTTEGTCCSFDPVTLRPLWEHHVYYPLFQGAVVLRGHPADTHVDADQPPRSSHSHDDLDESWQVLNDIEDAMLPSDAKSEQGSRHEGVPNVDVTSASAAYDDCLFAACAWDGNSFFFDAQGHHVQFSLQQEVACFQMGRYGSRNQLCAIYACFGEGVFVYDLLASLPKLQMKQDDHALRMLDL